MSRGVVGFWASLPGRLLHPLQLQIIEAMLWIDRPVSACELEHVVEEGFALATVSYHMRRLATLEVLKLSRTKQVRGARQSFYRLRPIDE
jgi:hypothetical protein